MAGRSALRPHVKAFKSTALARRLADAGHPTFCCATVREMVGMAEAGLGEDLLLANESLDLPPPHRRSSRRRTARFTVAVDSDETVEAAAAAGVREVLVDVDVGLPRCGCDPDDAGRLADLARSKGIEVRGVMGYEGHLMREPGDTKADLVERVDGRCCDQAHDAVGGDIVSGGGTGTWDVNHWITELQAGSVLPDGHRVHAPRVEFGNALFVLDDGDLPHRRRGWGVLDAGLKALGMDHGDPTVVDVGDCWFVLRRAHHLRRGRGRRRAGRRRPGAGAARPRRPDRRRTTSASTSSTATRSSTCGRSTSAAGSRSRGLRDGGSGRRKARARWLMACFSAGDISAKVRPSPSAGTKIGS